VVANVGAAAGEHGNAGSGRRRSADTGIARGKDNGKGHTTPGVEGQHEGGVEGVSNGGGGGHGDGGKISHAYLKSALDHFNDNLVKLANQYAEIVLREQMALKNYESEKQKETHKAELEKKHSSLLAMQVERDAAVEAQRMATEAKDAAVEAKDAAVEAKNAAVKAKDAAVKAKDAAVKAKNTATAELTASNNENDGLRSAMLLMVTTKRPPQNGGSANAGTDDPDCSDAAPEGLEGSAAGDGSKNV